MHFFFVPDIHGNHCILDAEESRHCVKVLRLEKGDHVKITDGKGSMYKAEVEEPSPKACVLRITEQHKETAPAWNISLAIAPTKNIARIEWLLEKLTEIGIAELLPFISHHSERRILKTDRLSKIAIEAMKQSGRTYLPKVDELVSYKELLAASKDFKGQKFILHCIEKDKETFHKVYKKGENALILIGPEGDFNNNEVEDAIGHGFTPITLGDVRYRTETAALVAACEIHTLNA